MIVINRTKAESLTLDRLRAERPPRFQALDVAYTRAQEKGMDTTAIVEQKDALRDVTDKPLDGLTIEQLAALTLDGALIL